MQPRRTDTAAVGLHDPFDLVRVGGETREELRGLCRTELAPLTQFSPIAEQDLGMETDAPGHLGVGSHG
jgi:hypothetical protein